MPAEEWIEGGDLIPSCDQLCIGVAEEAAHVSTCGHQEHHVGPRRSSAGSSATGIAGHCMRNVLHACDFAVDDD